jgi:hypothetical protein
MTQALLRKMSRAAVVLLAASAALCWIMAAAFVYAAERAHLVVTQIPEGCLHIEERCVLCDDRYTLQDVPRCCKATLEECKHPDMAPMALSQLHRADHLHSNIIKTQTRQLTRGSACHSQDVGRLCSKHGAIPMLRLRNRH